MEAEALGERFSESEQEGGEEQAPLQEGGHSSAEEEGEEEGPGEGEGGDHDDWGSEGAESPESEGSSSSRGTTADEGYDGEDAYLSSHDGDEAQGGEEEDKGARLDSLGVKVNDLEQKIFSLQDPSQEEVNDLAMEEICLRMDYDRISGDMGRALMTSLEDLWFALCLTSLEAVIALQEALCQFPAAEASVWEAESGSPEGFLQAARSKDTLEKLRDIYYSLNTLRNYPLMDPLKKVDAVQGEVGSWCTALLRFLPKEKTNTLQEKVEAVPGISPEHAGALKSKMDALQEQMGALKEMTALLAEADKLFCQLWSYCEIQENTYWEKTRDLAVTLKVHLKALPQEEGHHLWGKVAHFEDILQDTPVEKHVELEEKLNACLRKLGVLQNNLCEPLVKELEFLREKLQSLGDSSHGELDELQEELEELQKDLDFLQRHPERPFPACTTTALQRNMNILHEKMNAPLMVDAPLVVNDEERHPQRSPSPIHGIRRDEQPTLQSPCIQPPGVTSVAATIGEVQPPQLPRGTSTSTGTIQMLDTVQMNNGDSGCLIQPVQRSNAGSVSMHVPGGVVINSLNMIRPQNSRLSHSSIHQPCVPCYEFSAYTVVDIPPAQPQIPLGVAPFLPTPVSSPGSQPTPFPDTLQRQSTSLGQASSGSTSSNPI